MQLKEFSKASKNKALLEYLRLRDYDFPQDIEEIMDKPSRNDPCPCGSGKKYKKCCGVSQKTKKIQAVDLTEKAASKIGSLFSKKVEPVKPKDEKPKDDA